MSTFVGQSDLHALQERHSSSVFFTSSSCQPPPTISPCYYGVDTPTREELLASDASIIRPRLPEGSRADLPDAARTLEEIRLFLDADSVGYLSLESLRRAVGDTTGSFCTSCYTGCYVPEKVQLEVTVPAGSREQVAVPEGEGKHRER